MTKICLFLSTARLKTKLPAAGTAKPRSFPLYQLPSKNHTACIIRGGSLSVIFFVCFN